MAKEIKLVEIGSRGSRTWYTVNDCLKVLNHCGTWHFENDYPLYINDDHYFKTIEELVAYFNTHIAPNRIKIAKKLIQFYEETKDI